MPAHLGQQRGELIGRKPTMQLPKELNEQRAIGAGQRGLEVGGEPIGERWLAGASADAPLLDQAVPLEHGELGPDGIIGHAEGGRQLVHRALTAAEEGDQAAASGLEETLTPW